MAKTRNLLHNLCHSIFQFKQSIPRKATFSSKYFKYGDALPFLNTSQYLEAATRGVLQKKGVLKNFVKLTGKHMCQSLFFDKVIIKRDSGTGIFL